MSRCCASLLVVLGLAACGGSDSTGPTATTAVDVRDNVFSPSAITVGTQATVTWTWRGSDTHNVTFEDGQGSSGTQVSGTHGRPFATAGTFRYRCTIHSTSFTSGMVGSVAVQ
jgi:plastocyanin